MLFELVLFAAALFSYPGARSAFRCAYLLPFPHLTLACCRQLRAACRCWTGTARTRRKARRPLSRGESSLPVPSKDGRDVSLSERLCSTQSSDPNQFWTHIKLSCLRVYVMFVICSNVLQQGLRQVLKLEGLPFFYYFEGALSPFGFAACKRSLCSLL